MSLLKVKYIEAKNLLEEDWQALVFDNIPTMTYDVTLFREVKDLFLETPIGAYFKINWETLAFCSPELQALLKTPNLLGCKNPFSIESVLMNLISKWPPLAVREIPQIEPGHVVSKPLTFDDLIYVVQQKGTPFSIKAFNDIDYFQLILFLGYKNQPHSDVEKIDCWYKGVIPYKIIPTIFREEDLKSFEAHLISQNSLPFVKMAVELICKDLDEVPCPECKDTPNRVVKVRDSEKGQVIHIVRACIKDHKWAEEVKEK